MAWTQSDVDTLKAAIATGAVVKSITFADQTMQFRSLDEMERVLAMMLADVNAASPQYRRRFAAYSKGTDC